MARSVMYLAIGWLYCNSAAHEQANPNVGSPVNSPSSQQTAAASRILTDSVLWGRDFPKLLAYLQSFERAEQRDLLVFADRAVLTTAFRSRDAANATAERLRRGVADLRTNQTPLFRKQIGKSRDTLTAPTVEIIPEFAEDRSIRVAVAAQELLPAGLTIAAIRRRLGAPERTTTELIEGPGESRPLVLTLYSYAGGAVVFAEADIAPRPGFLNRVRLNVPIAIRALEDQR